jgi:hypothetical protein
MDKFTNFINGGRTAIIKKRGLLGKKQARLIRMANES